MKKIIRLKDDLSWRELKALNSLYVEGKTDAKVQGYDYFKYLMDDLKLINTKEGNSKVLIASDEYDSFYEKSYKSRFEYYSNFLVKNGLETDARKNYNEFDIKTLNFILANKSQIIPNLTTLHKFSNLFFEGKGSKYLENKKSVLDAVYKILDIQKFPAQDPKENLWRFVVDCPSPEAVVLCENLDFLKTYWIAEENNLKLWYVGGNNTGIINKIDRVEFNRPFFYSGDWDLAGLKIYCRVKEILANYNKEIILLYPNDPENRLTIDVQGHKSRWDFNKKFSGLDSVNFNVREIELITNLIQNDEWIEEESNDLIEMMKKQ